MNVRVVEGRGIAAIDGREYLLEPLSTMINLADMNELIADFKQFGERLKDKVVFDIGAGNGLSSLLAIHYGARRVIAVEPTPFYYDALLLAIKLNGMEDKIVPVKAAVGASRGTVRVPRGLLTYCFIFFSAGGEEVEVTTLCDLVDKYAEGLPPSELALIADCEGCEWFFGSCVDRFGFAVVEWHGRDIDVSSWKVLRDRGIIVKSVKNGNMG